MELINEKINILNSQIQNHLNNKTGNDKEVVNNINEKIENLKKELIQNDNQKQNELQFSKYTNEIDGLKNLLNNSVSSQTLDNHMNSLNSSIRESLNNLKYEMSQNNQSENYSQILVKISLLEQKIENSQENDKKNENQENLLKLLEQFVLNQNSMMTQKHEEILNLEKEINLINIKNQNEEKTSKSTDDSINKVIEDFNNNKNHLENFINEYNENDKKKDLLINDINEKNNFLQQEMINLKNSQIEVKNYQENYKEILKILKETENYMNSKVIELQNEMLQQEKANKDLENEKTFLQVEQESLKAKIEELKSSVKNDNLVTNEISLEEKGIEKDDELIEKLNDKIDAQMKKIEKKKSEMLIIKKHMQELHDSLDKDNSLNFNSMNEINRKQNLIKNKNDLLNVKTVNLERKENICCNLGNMFVENKVRIQNCIIQRIGERELNHNPPKISDNLKNEEKHQNRNSVKNVDKNEIKKIFGDLDNHQEIQAHPKIKTGHHHHTMGHDKIKHKNKMMKRDLDKKNLKGHSGNNKKKALERLLNDPYFKSKNFFKGS